MYMFWSWFWYCTEYVDIKHNGQWKIAENEVHTFFWYLVYIYIMF